PEMSLVFYMSSHNAAHIQARLQAVRGGTVPVLIVENAGRRSARAVKGTLAQLSTLVQKAAFDGPVLIGVGPVFTRARVAGSLVAHLAPKTASHFLGCAFSALADQPDCTAYDGRRAAHR